ncbi:diablo homolog, mitochondrial-like [Conger conger]|uniref:diablo homolog, mitochondrial-like n=1 Tax=Conger conger TaxID=82655 RepID=UPI002A5ABD89|nr:diablo homolog, mitochondrial-like [Conger conger]
MQLCSFPRCVTWGILDRRTDFLLFSCSMAAFRRSIFSFGLLRNTEQLLRSGNSAARQRLTGFPAAVRKNWISLCTAGGLCAVPFTQKQGEGLSHEALVRRASSLVTDSANTFLSQTTLALVDSLTQYVKAAHMLVALQKRYVASVTRLNPSEEHAVWEVIIRQRAEVREKRDDCKQFESTWMKAINLCELAAEAAYNAGADQASVTARSSLQVALSHVEQAQQRALEADRLLEEFRAEKAERTAHLASAPAEEDVPEAYLRED